MLKRSQETSVEHPYASAHTPSHINTNSTNLFNVVYPAKPVLPPLPGNDSGPSSGSILFVRINKMRAMTDKRQYVPAFNRAAESWSSFNEAVDGAFRDDGLDGPLTIP